jgi:hypothetical protein
MQTARIHLTQMERLRGDCETLAAVEEAWLAGLLVTTACCIAPLHSQQWQGADFDEKDKGSAIDGPLVASCGPSRCPWETLRGRIDQTSSNSALRGSLLKTRSRTGRPMSQMSLSNILTRSSGRPFRTAAWQIGDYRVCAAVSRHLCR